MSHCLILKQMIIQSLQVTLICSPRFKQAWNHSSSGRSNFFYKHIGTENRSCTSHTFVTKCQRASNHCPPTKTRHLILVIQSFKEKSFIYHIWIITSTFSLLLTWHGVCYLSLMRWFVLAEAAAQEFLQWWLLPAMPVIVNSVHLGEWLM